MWMDAPCRGERGRRRRRPLVVALLLAGVVPVHTPFHPPVHALSTDSEQPIEIVADGAEHDDARRMTTYRGSVVVEQGSLHMSADTVVVLFDANDRVMKITSTGAPGHFRQLPDGETDYRKAWAKQMEYFPEQDLINLSGAARYEKDGNQVQADRLVYDSLNARFRALTDTAAPPSGEGARATGKKSERVRIQIRPQRSTP